jgi:hypothetical protein
VIQDGTCLEVQIVLIQADSPDELSGLLLRGLDRKPLLVLRIGTRPNIGIFVLHWPIAL